VSSPARSVRLLLLALVYVAAMVAALAIVNENADNTEPALVIWGAATVVCGWFARNVLFALLALLAIPISLPFGYAEEWVGSDAPLVLYAGFFYGLFSGIAIVLLVVIRWLATAPREASPIVSRPAIRAGALVAASAALLGLAVTLIVA
jgi:hypothetical protein